MNFSSNPTERVDMLAWLALQGDDTKDYDNMSDHELRVLYEERKKASDDYIDNYNETPEPLNNERDIDEKTR